MSFKQVLVEELQAQYEKNIADKKKLDIVQKDINDFVKEFGDEIKEVLDVSRGKVEVESFNDHDAVFAKIRIDNVELQFKRFHDKIEVVTSKSLESDSDEVIDNIYPVSGEDYLCKVTSGGYLNEYALNRFLQEAFERKVL